MMDKVRVHEIAKELGVNSKEVVDKATAMGLNLKTASSTVSMEEAEKIMNYIMSGAAVESHVPKTVAQEEVVVSNTEVKAEVKAPAVAVEVEPVSVAQVAKVPQEQPSVEVPEVDVSKRSGLKIVKKVRPVEEAVVIPKYENVNVSQ
ncbi:MAG: translation initiation factor IF-2 N-terminal domain-containing protein [Epsilonproteobacteria bacterium]|nr:translation initiation factor IF-2 N-terminal domain-containing protein [Campylobacterota bacterium]